MLLCGGSGTRLWPLSRKNRPKQFTNLLGERTLLQETALRLSGQGFAAPVAVTAEDFGFVVADQLAEAGCVPHAILLEPEPRNTAPAILAAALHLAEQDPDALMLVAPCDHRIEDPEGFRAAVAAAAGAALDARLLTFGILPTRPETAYGWLLPAAAEEVGWPRPVQAFVEKPEAARALELLATGAALWNSGVFLFTARSIIEQYQLHTPDLVEPVRSALADATMAGTFVRLEREAWRRATSISIDHAILERSTNVWTMPYGGRWSDLGSWGAVRHELQADADGNVCSPEALAIDCRDTLLRSDAEGLTVVGLGLSNVMAVAMQDAVLVADLSHAQHVGRAVEVLRERQVRQGDAFHLDHRPWGWFETLGTGEGFHVKKLVVKPGESLSLQSHRHRAEHWIVVRGSAVVTLDDEVSTLSVNQSIYIPAGRRHRLQNPGNTPLMLVEVQTGSYLGEDDIVRHEDQYARS